MLQAGQAADYLLLCGDFRLLIQQIYIAIAVY